MRIRGKKSHEIDSRVPAVGNKFLILTFKTSHINTFIKAGV